MFTEETKLENAINFHNVMLMKAAFWSAKKHSGDRRKNKEKDPYVNHTLEVANYVAEAGGDCNAIIAGMCHDTIEHGHATYEELILEFGKTTADLVLELTDDPTLAREEQVQAQIHSMKTKSYGARLVKMADQLSNLKSLLENPPIWKPEHIVAYAKKTKDVFDAGRGTSFHLEFLFDIQYKKTCEVLKIGPSYPTMYC
jgi:GTP diphosphokinase / guanosine-3',5'-bis(diphosphate) 3'-diphosphatase